MVIIKRIGYKKEYTVVRKTDKGDVIHTNIAIGKYEDGWAFIPTEGVGYRIDEIGEIYKILNEANELDKLQNTLEEVKNDNNKV